MRYQSQILAIELRRAGIMLCQALLILLIGLAPAAAQALTEQTPPVKQNKNVRPSPQSTELAPKPGEDEIIEARELLGALGYWVNLDLKVLDVSLRHALIAFQKFEGRPRTGVLNKDELEALRKARRPQAREIGYPHIEIDVCRQVLFAVDCCGAILRILPVSTGSGKCFTEGGRTRRAVTPLGRFKVQRKFKGWRKSPLGLLYYPSYIYGGVAIHGNPAVPVEPASHGCIRIPMFAAKEFFEMATIGMDVFIYDSSTINEEPPSAHP